MSDIIYLTQEWLTKLQEELRYLKEEKRVEIAERLKEAISFWDLSENAEYEEARNEQAQVELRISDIEEQLKHVEIIKEGADTGNKVSMGSYVTLLDLQENEESSYKIVGSTESDILDQKETKISNESPIWAAILGKKKGAVVKVKAPAGVFEFKITNIS